MSDSKCICERALIYKNVILDLEKNGELFKQPAKMAVCECGETTFDGVSMKVLLELGYIKLVEPDSNCD